MRSLSVLLLGVAGAALAAGDASALVMPAAPPAPALVAKAQFATEWTQIANNFQLIQMGGEQIRQSTQFAQQIANQVQQIQTQLQMYQSMVQNTAALPDRIWDQAQADIRRLTQLSQQGSGLAYGMSDVDSVFRQRFGTYDSFLSQQMNGATFSQQYSSWSQTQRDTIASTLKTANLTGDQLTTDADLLRALQAQSGSADGQMKALQVGHQLASLQADQMMKLRALLAQQTVMFGQVFGRQQAIDEQYKANEKRYFTDAYVDPNAGQRY